MLSVAERYLRDLNADARPILYGQDHNDEAWAVCRSDMLIKGEDADRIVLGDTFLQDGFPDERFDYMLANPPFGVEWKQQQRGIEKERDTLGHAGRFGAGTPRINDGALLFLQHMLAKMRAPDAGGSRLGFVFNGSPLFTGDAGSGESEIRRWIIENDWLEAVVALPDQLFYNTGISTYLWVLTNRKTAPRRGKIQLLDARNFWIPMRKSLGNKRHKIGDADEGDPDHISEITRVYGAFRDGEAREFTVDGQRKTLVVSKVFDNEDFGFHKITMERPLRLNFEGSEERIARLDDEPGFRNLVASTRKDEEQRLFAATTGRERQEAIRALLRRLRDDGGRPHLHRDRAEFLAALKMTAKQAGERLDAVELKAIVAALGERDETAEICRDAKGQPEPDPDLRDTENVPLKERIEDYFAREVLPHVPDAWIDHSKTKVGYEIPLNRHFYRYEPPRPLEEIETDIKTLEGEILALLKEITA